MLIMVNCFTSREVIGLYHAVAVDVPDDHKRHQYKRHQNRELKPPGPDPRAILGEMDYKES